MIMFKLRFANFFSQPDRVFIWEFTLSLSSQLATKIASFADNFLDAIISTKFPA